MTPQEQLAQIAAIATGGNAGYPRFQGGPRSHEMDRAVQQPGLIDMAGPLVAGVMGMPNPQPLPRVAPGQGVGEAWYAQRVATRQWQMFQDSLARQSMLGIGSSVDSVVQGLGGPQALGLTNKEYRKGLSGWGTNPSDASMKLWSALSGNELYRAMAGGSPMAVHEAAFANRRAIGQVWGLPANPLDPRASDASNRIALDLAKQITVASRGSGPDSVGLTPNFGYTRGFSTETQAGLLQHMVQGGAFGNLADRAFRAGEGTAGYEKVMEGAKNKFGEIQKTFEALGDMIGSHDLQDMMAAFEQLNVGDLEKLDFGALRGTFRELEATAQTFGIAKKEMFGTITSMQQVMQGSSGLNAAHIAAGMTGGGYGGPEMAGVMAKQAFATAHATGRTSEADIQRIASQQAGLRTVAMQSTAGRATRMIAYLNQQGLVSDDRMAAFERAVKSGSTAERDSVIDKVFSEAYGSAAEGRRLMNDSNYMLMVNERSTTGTAIRAGGLMDTGQSREWTEHSATRQERALGRMARGNLNWAGMGADIDAAGADARMAAIAGSLRDQGSASGASYLQQVYNDAIRSGKTKVEAMTLMEGQLNSVGALTKYKNGAMAAANATTTALQTDRFMRGGSDAAQATAAMDDITGFGTDSASAEQKREMERIQDLARTDPSAAAAAARKFVGSASFLTADQRALVTGHMNDIAGEAQAKGVAMQGLQTSANRLKTGAKAGLTAGAVAKEQTLLAQLMKDRIATGDANKFDTKVGELKSLNDVEKARLKGMNGAELQEELKRQGGVNASLIQNTAEMSSTSKISLESRDAGMEAARGKTALDLANKITPGLAAHNEAMAQEQARRRRNALQGAVDGITGKANAADALNVQAGPYDGWMRSTNAQFQPAKSGAAGGGNALQLTGTLRMLDSGGVPMGTVNIDANGK